VLAPYQKAVMIHGNKGDIATWMSPLKIFEYMSHGKAIVASDLPVLREILADGHNALLVPPDDIERWKGALQRLEQDASVRQTIGAAAFDALQRTFLARRKQGLAAVEPDPLRWPGRLLPVL
jgi:glycosyltransferase involved in cell wall biosynthesis